MKLKQIRNSTYIVTYAGKKFLIDPSFELSVPIDEVLDVDAVIITRMLDKLDVYAMEFFPYDMHFFVPNEELVELMKESGFPNVELLKDYGSLFHNIWLIQTPTKYSLSFTHTDMSKAYQETCGVILNHIREKSLYIMGNTTLNEDIHDILMDTSPDIAVFHVGHSKYIDERYVNMNQDDFLDISKSTRNTMLLASCIHSVNSCMSFVGALKNLASDHDLSHRMSILYDGLTYET